MEKKTAQIKISSFEKRSLYVLSVGFLVVIVASWIFALNLKQTIATNNSAVSSDLKALVEVERIRNLAEAQIDDSLSFFLMGSSAIFEEQKKDKLAFMASLVSFEKQYSLPGSAEVVKRLTSLQAQQQDIFDQGMEYRSKQTESKIIGQFYRSKTNSVRAAMNQALNELAQMHSAEAENMRLQAQQTTFGAEQQIPKGMAWLSGMMSSLFLGMTFLITRLMRERKRNLGERERLYREAQDAAHSRDEVVSAIAQDLKEPLRDMKSGISKLIQNPIDSKWNENIEFIQSAAMLVEDRVQDILDQTRATSKMLSLRVEQRGLDTILDEARLMMLPLAKQKDIRLEVNPVNPPVLAFLDSERVLRVLSNLIDNAIKFSPRMGKIIVKVRSDQQFVFVSVKDSGPGIPESQLGEVFSRFWQARKTSEEGPGIGLAVVKTIIEAHGGVVSVESHVGHGSTFTFSLPRRRPSGLHIAKPAAPASKTTGRPPMPQEFLQRS